MNRCLTYKCIIILLIGYVYSADKPTEQPPVSSESDSDEDDNFNVIVRGIENLLEEEDDQQFHSIQTAPIQQPTHPTPHTSQVTQFPQYYEPTPLQPLTEPSPYTVDYPGYHTHPQYYTVHQPFQQYPTQSVAGQQPYQLQHSQYPPQPTDKPKEQKTDITTYDDELDDGIEYDIYLQEFKEEWASIEPVILQLPLTVFLKKDSSGNLIPMNKSDLVLKMDCKSFTKVDFIGNCSKFYQNKQFVWVNKDRSAYPISLIYKKYTNMFNLIFCDKILSFKPYFQKWMMKVFLFQVFSVSILKTKEEMILSSVPSNMMLNFVSIIYLNMFSGKKQTVQWLWYMMK